MRRTAIGSAFAAAAGTMGAIALAGTAACGGGSADSQGASAPIASMPAYPAASANTTAASATPVAATAPSSDPKTFCANAQPIPATAKQSALSPSDLEAAEKHTLFADLLDRQSAHAPNAKTDSMADLQALEKRSSWSEILDHAEDIAPAQRNAAWDKVVDAAATGYLSQLTSKSDAYEGVFASKALIQRYPKLTSSTGFMTQRSTAAKTAAAQCLQDSYRGQHCIDMMKDFLTVTNTDADVGLAFGQIARKNQNAYVAVPFFDWALTKKGDASYCGDEDLGLAVVAGLGLPPEYENAAGARHIAQGACWSTLQPAVTKEFGSSPGAYYRDNACAVLKAKGAL